MRSRSELAIAVLKHQHDVLSQNINELTLDEALAAAGGHRSILGILKHAAAWSHIYRSYAFDNRPVHWAETSWPRGLRDTIEATRDYLDEVIAWLQGSYTDWEASLGAVSDEGFDELRRVHWGGTMPLFDIVILIGSHWAYHTGEINAVLAILRGQAWEYTEEIEENHISTRGHRIRPGWMSDTQAAAHEAYSAARDAELHGA